MRALLLLMSVLWAPFASASLTPDLGHLNTLPIHATAPDAVSMAIAKADQNRHGPYVFAVTVPLPITLDGGAWDQLNATTERWRTRVTSSGARSLLLDFSQFHLPPGAALWFYDAQGNTVQGPYTADNNNADHSLWTATVPGDTAVIELHVPADERDQVQLTLGKLGHGFKNARDLGSAGACEIDVVCPLGSGWPNEIRSTVKLQIPAGPGLVTLCSGTLVNNTAQDDRALILTANHCGIGTTGSPASGVVTYWNFNNSACGGTPDAPDTQNQTGSTVLASDANTDVTLIELSSKPSAAFNVYYSGWDASGAGANSGVGTHHPAGDAKKISAFNTPLVQSNVQIQTLGPTIPAWQVNWSQAATEQGSSGSAIWNQNHRLVGTLSGGNSACSGSTGNGGDDFYARMDQQWASNSAASAQLKAWLDPINSGCLVVDGKNPGSATPLNCGGSGTGTPPPGGGTTTSGGGGGGGAITTDLLMLLGGLGLLRRQRARFSARRASRA